MCGTENVVKDLYVGRSEIYSFYGKIPYCKKCIEKIYKKYFEEFQDEKKAVYMMCQRLDIPFKYSAYEGALKDASKRSWEIYQAYIGKINSLGSTNNYGNCFDDSDKWVEINQENLSNDDEDNDFEVTNEMKIFWGFGLDKMDYYFLEIELEEWKKTHKCDNRAELTLLKEICLKVLEIRKAREKKENVSKEQRDLQDLMKTASLDPAKANIASAGKSVDAFGVWVKDIETKRPAEWWEDQEKYKDMDGFTPYIKKYIVRPIKNFFTGSKDFNIDDIDIDTKDAESGEEDV